MGGRGSVGGTRSTYRGESTTLFRQKQAQGGDAGSGGGGGSSKNKGGNAGAGTGGIEGGGGSVEGGGGSTVDTKKTETDQTTDTDSSTATDINEQDFSTLTDEELKDLFEESEAFEVFLAKDVSDAAYSREYNNSFTRWVQSNAAEQEPETPKLEVNFGAGLTDTQKSEAIAALDTVPLRYREELEARGVRVQVAARADQAPGWDETGYTSSQQIADGREIGDLSFYSDATKQVFISVNAGTGSVNLYVHELGHAIDFNWFKVPGYKDDPAVEWRKTVEWPPGSGTTYKIDRVSDDPEWINVHLDLISTLGLKNYYKYGPNDPPASGASAPPAHLRAGREELFAEGLAQYVTGGVASLTGFVHSLDKALKLEAIWKKYGVVE